VLSVDLGRGCLDGLEHLAGVELDHRALPVGLAMSVDDRLGELASVHLVTTLADTGGPSRQGTTRGRGVVRGPLPTCFLQPDGQRLRDLLGDAADPRDDAPGDGVAVSLAAGRARQRP
jgi:hypothetical protein